MRQNEMERQALNAFHWRPKDARGHHLHPMQMIVLELLYFLESGLRDRLVEDSRWKAEDKPGLEQGKWELMGGWHVFAICMS